MGTNGALQAPQFKILRLTNGRRTRDRFVIDERYSLMLLLAEHPTPKSV